MVSPVSVPAVSSGDPRKIGRYVIGAALRRGAMGTVYRAEDPLIRRKVALKVLALERPGQPDFRARFVHEAMAAGRLDHPNIVTIHDVGASGDGYVYVAMEFLAGLTLRESLDSGIVFPLQKVVDVALRVLRGLDCAHRQDVVHGDVKPANIMLAHDGIVKIMDFGIALAAEARKVRDDWTPGSPTYLAPEQVTGAPVDARTDVFALGVTLYELLTGSNPFAGDTMEMAFRNVLRLDPPPPATLNPDVPPELDRIVMQALAREPGARFASARAMSDALAPVCTLLRDGPATTRPPSEPSGALGEATRVPADVVPRPEPLPSTVEDTRASSSRRSALVLSGAAASVLVLFLAMDRIDGGGDDAARYPDPPAPLAAAPGTAVPAEADRGATDPVTAGPVTADPVTADPVSADPVSADPVSADPIAADSISQAPPAAPDPGAPDPAARLPSPPRTEAAVAEVTPPALTPKDRVAPARGKLGLAVLPWGEVYVNGRRRGVTPPLRGLELPPGSYRVEIRNADFPPRIQRVKIESGKSVTIRYRFR